MVTGLPGTGKSTFAAHLSEAIGAQHLNTDIIRDAMGKRGSYDANTKATVYDEMLRQAAQLLQAGQSIIIDGTFYQKKLRQPYLELSHKLNIPIYWLEVKAAEEVVRTRVSHRRMYSEADFEVYLKIKSQYEQLDAPHLELWSDEYSNMNEMIEKTKKYLSSSTTIL